MADKARKKECYNNEQFDYIVTGSASGPKHRTQIEKQLKLNKYRGVAQMVARLLWEQDAAGSTPVTPTKIAVSTSVGTAIFIEI